MKRVGGGIKTANNLAVTEEGFALDARQGKVLNEKITETKNDLSKMIQVSGRVGEDADWNDFITAGVYIVQAATMTAEYHAPVGIYPYGTLEVLVSKTVTPNRILQVYYPHIINRGGNEYAMATRTCEGNTWQPWYAVSGILLE